jgi:hypothetical protein
MISILKSVHHASGAGKTGFASPIYALPAGPRFPEGMSRSYRRGPDRSQQSVVAGLHNARKDHKKVEETEMAGNRGSALLIFFTGLGAGIAVTVLLAPRAGAATRRLIGRN